MGLQDREYMRDRARSRIGRQTFDYGNGRWKTSPLSGPRNGDLAGPKRVQILIVALLIVYAMLKWGGVGNQVGLFDGNAPVPFPATGTFEVRSDHSAFGTAPLTIKAGPNDTVLQLLDHDGKPVFLVYIAALETVRVEAPIGTWRLRTMHGPVWQGQENLFGLRTQVQESMHSLGFSEQLGHIIDLNERIGGNLKTETKWNNPALKGK